MGMGNSYFETRFRYSPKKEAIWKVLCGYLQQFIPENSRVIDVGAGYCYFINNIRAGEKYALDVDGEILRKYASEDVNLVVASATDTKLQSNFFLMWFLQAIY